MGKKLRPIRKAIARKKSPSRSKGPASESAASRAFRVLPSRFALEEKKGWTYNELHPQPTTGRRYFTTSVSPLPHLVLRDAVGVARFTLSYRLRDDGIQLEEIQRCRTAEWSSASEHPTAQLGRETLLSKQFQAQLNGVHPSEFLLIQFLFAHRKEIIAGKKVSWSWSVYSTGWAANNIANTLYPSLAKHYFKRVGARPTADIDHRSTWELDLGKLRTREALGLMPQKKKK